MTTWIILALYATGWVITARKAAHLLLNDTPHDQPDLGDQIAARMLGFLVGGMWPVILLGALVNGRLPKTDKQLRAEHAAQAQRIAELEHELGIEKGPHHA
ncbi:hypothetical protein [Thermoactinospora rubra]|uniref:hypothetical protein n=1 Tax=Thermoactinospora rubra TaxID=1088767 RepID=UPI000A11C8C5|nr:hypothetical protein [Thermoactinospora rubra]